MPIWEYTAHSLTYMYLLFFPQVLMRLVDIFFFHLTFGNFRLQQIIHQNCVIMLL